MQGKSGNAPCSNRDSGKGKAMTEQVEFVPAKAGDAESIGRLRQRIWDTTYRGIYPDAAIDGFDYEWHRERDLRRISDPSFMVYLIRCGGVDIGYLIFRETDTGVWLHSLYVVREHQHRGIGRQAFGILKDYCAERGTDRFACNCNPHNENAIRFYRRMGGAVTGTDTGHENRQEDSVIFEFVFADGGIPEKPGICEGKMTLEIKPDLKGSILDIGGGGEAVIGRVYGDRVTAIDNCQEELDEAPNCCTKLLMDAEELSFADGSFDNVTFFYTLMYMTEKTQGKAICEATRVLKAGGTLCIWDCTIPAAYPEPFVADLDIQFADKKIHTSYGIVKQDVQSSDSIRQLLENAGLDIVSLKEENGQFHFMCRKRPSLPNRR